jgi:hypothetical protein
VPESGPLPGWYADPSGEHEWRWWSGSIWTTHTASRPGFVPDATRVAQLAAEVRMARFAPWAALLLAASMLAGIAFDWSIASQLSRDVHWIRLAIKQSETTHGSFPPLPNQSFTTLAWSYLLWPVTLGSEVALLVWQFRSAKVALSLGYPARVSPTWGVAFWFIPVVQLWLPYLAVRDLLPKGHRMRRLMGYWWCSVIVAVLLESAMPVLLAFAHPLGVALIAPEAVSVVVLGALSRAIVIGVASAHSAASSANSTAEGGWPYA